MEVVNYFRRMLLYFAEAVNYFHIPLLLYINLKCKVFDFLSKCFSLNDIDNYK